MSPLSIVHVCVLRRIARNRRRFSTVNFAGAKNPCCQGQGFKYPGARKLYGKGSDGIVNMRKGCGTCHSMDRISTSNTFVIDMMRDAAKKAGDKPSERNITISHINGKSLP